MMLDDESLGAALQPTRANILREIQKLVGGARDGSSLIFFYSGHSGQVEGEIPNKHEEDDGLDEFIVPIDHDEPIRPNLSGDETGIGSRGKAIKKRMITDNKLRKMLVDSLPIGAQITAIFDSYHSGTLLDLDHYLCDNVYSPWTNKHKNTMLQDVPRKPEHGQRMNRSTSRLPRDPPAHIASPRSPLSGEGSSANVRNVRIYSRQRVSSTEVEVTNTHVGVDDIDEGERPLQSGRTFIYARPRRVPSGIAPRTRCADSLVKDGNMFAGEHGFGGTGVVSISSCHGAQPTWEPKKGSFTQWLIDILRREPNQPIGSFLRELTDRMYGNGQKTRGWTRKRRVSGKVAHPIPEGTDLFAGTGSEGPTNGNLAGDNGHVPQQAGCQYSSPCLIH